jgi:hypothetical protein
VAGQDLEVALEVPDIPPPRGANAELLRSASGDALAIAVRSTGWFIHPVDLEARAVDAPFIVSPAQLASMPEPCNKDAEGFVLTTAVTPDPYAEVSSPVTMRAFEGRFRISALGVCLDALAAQGDAGPPAKLASAQLRATGRPTVTATLTERKPLGRRIELRCSN